MRTRLKKWCSKDIHKLTVLYYMGATDQKISTFLNRSPQSIGKKITRLKLRPINSESHIITPGQHLPKEISSADLLKLVTQEINLLKDSNSFMETLLRRYPFYKKTKVISQNTRPFKTLQDDKGQWRSLQEIGQFIQERRHSVTEKHCARTGSTHIVNGQRKRPLDLLMVANKICLRENQKIFFLDGHTQY